MCQICITDFAQWQLNDMPQSKSRVSYVYLLSAKQEQAHLHHLEFKGNQYTPGQYWKRRANSVSKGVTLDRKCRPSVKWKSEVPSPHKVKQIVQTFTALQSKRHEPFVHDAPEVRPCNQFLPHVTPLVEVNGIKAIQVELQRHRLTCSTTPKANDNWHTLLHTAHNCRRSTVLPRSRRKLHNFRSWQASQEIHFRATRCSDWCVSEDVPSARHIQTRGTAECLHMPR